MSAIRSYQGWAALTADPSYVLVLWQSNGDNFIDVCEWSGKGDIDCLTRLCSFKELPHACASIERKTQGAYKPGDPVELDFEWFWDDYAIFNDDRASAHKFDKFGYFERGVK